MPCQSGLYTAARNENTNYVPAHTLVNGRLTWRNPGGELDVSLEVANLMDKYYRLTVFDQTSGQGAVAEQPGRAREWASNVTKRFYVPPRLLESGAETLGKLPAGHVGVFRRPTRNCAERSG